MDIRGDGAAVTGYSIHTSDPEKPIRLTITGGNTLVNGSLFENVRIEVDDQTGLGCPSSFMAI